MVRKGYGRHSVVATGANNPSSQISKDAWNDDLDKTGMLGFSSTTSTIVISTGNLTVTDTWTVAESETSPTADDLTNILTTETSTEDIVFLIAKAGDTITLKHQAGGAGQIHTLTGLDQTLDTNVPTLLIRRGTDWYEYGGSNPIAGTNIDVTGPTVSFDPTGGVDLLNNNLTLGTGQLIFENANSYIASIGTDIAFNNDSVSEYRFRHNSTDTVVINNNSLSMEGNNLINFGYFESNATNPASTGAVRLGNNEQGISWRNTGNTADAYINYSNTDEIEIVNPNNTNIDLSINGIERYSFRPTEFVLNSVNTVDLNGAEIIDAEYLESNATNPASAGVIRLGYGELIQWRNQGNTANHSIGADSSDNLDLKVDGLNNLSVYVNGGIKFQVANSGTSLLGGNLIDIGGTTDSSVGGLRLANNTAIGWRNAGNTGDVTLNVDVNDEFLFLHNNNTSSITLEANHTTPAGGQEIGKIKFVDDDDLGARVDYAYIHGEIDDPTNTSKDSSIYFTVQATNSLVEPVRIYNNGLAMGSGYNIVGGGQGTSLSNIGSLSYANGTTLNADATQTTLTIPSGDFLEVRIGGGIEYTFNATSLDVAGNDITTPNSIIFDGGSSPAGSGHIRLPNGSTGIRWRNAGDTNDIRLSVDTNDDFVFDIDGVNEYAFSSTQADFLGNNIVNAGYFESNATNPASVGTLRLGNAEDLTWRDSSNQWNATFGFTGGNRWQWLRNGSLIATLDDTQFDVNNLPIRDVQYLESNDADPATAGAVRLGKTETIAWRNNANDGNLTFGVNTDDQLVYNGVPIGGSSSGGAGVYKARIASTANVNLASATDPNPIDGVTLANNDRILLKDQSTGAENGIYTAVTATDPTTWVRSSDFNTSAEVTDGALIVIQEGTFGADTTFRLTTNEPITLDTTALTFTGDTNLSNTSAIRWNNDSNLHITGDGGGLDFAVPSGDRFQFIIQGIIEYDFNSTTADFNGNNITFENGANINWNVGALSILGNATGFTFNVETGDDYTWQVNATTEMHLNNLELDIHDNNLRNANIIEVKGGGTASGSGDVRLKNDGWISWRNASNTNNVDAIKVNATDEIEMSTTVTLPLGQSIRFGAGAYDRIVKDGTGFDFRNPTGDDFKFSINGVNELIIQAGLINTGNNAVELGTGSLQLGNSDITITGVTSDIEFDVGTGNEFRYRVNNVEVGSIASGLTNFIANNAVMSLQLEGNHTTPADGQIVGNIDFVDDSSTGVRRSYARIEGLIQDPTNTLEDGEMLLEVMKGGSVTTYISINETDNDNINFNSKPLWGVGGIRLVAGAVYGGSIMQMYNNGNDLRLNVATGQLHQLAINTNNEYTFDATQADWLGNNLINVGYFESNATNPASTGAVRLGQNEGVYWRNFGNDGDHYMNFSGDAWFLNIGGTNVLQVDGADVNITSRDLDMSNNVIKFLDADQSIQSNSTNLEYDVATGGNHVLRINNVTEYQFSSTALTMNSNNLDMGTGTINFGAGEFINVTSNDMILEVTNGDFIAFNTGGTTRFQVNEGNISVLQPLNMNSQNVTSINRLEQENATGSLERNFIVNTAVADDTIIGDIKFIAKDGLNVNQNYAKITAVMESDVDASEDGSLHFYVTEAGTHDVEFMSMNDASSGDIEVYKDLEIQFGNYLRFGNINSIRDDGSGMEINVQTGDNFKFTINGGNEYIFDNVSADFLGNNLINVGYFESNATNPAVDGTIRLGNLEKISWRESDNSQDAFIRFGSDVSDSFFEFRDDGGLTGINAANIQLGNSTTVAPGGAVRLEQGGNVSWRDDLGTGQVYLTKEAGNRIVQVGYEIDFRTQGNNGSMPLTIRSQHATPANGDEIGSITFEENSSTSVLRNYGQIRTVIEDPTNTLEDGEMMLSVIVNGSLQDMITLNPANSKGITLNTSDLLFDSEKGFIDDATSLRYNVATGHTHYFTVNSVLEYEFSATALDVQGNNIVDIGIIQLGSGANNSIQLSGSSNQYDVATGGSHFLRVNDATEYQFSATNLDMNSNGLVMGSGVIEFGTPNVSIEQSGANMQFDVATGGNFVWRINDVTQLVFDGGQFDFNSSNVTDVGFLDFSTGSADTGTIRLPNANLIAWRNAGNTANVSLTVDANDQLNTTNGLVVGQMIQGAIGSDIASADAPTIPTDGSYFDITGTTQINHLTTTNIQAGTVIILQFDASVTLTHQAGTPTGDEKDLWLAGATNASMTANDTITLVYDGTNWRETARSVN